MRKILFALFLFSAFCLISPISAQAAGWTSVRHCRSDQMSPDNIRSYIKAPEGEDPQAIIDVLNSMDVCVRNDVTRFEISKLEGDTIKYCNSGQGKVVMRDMTSPDIYEPFCCPDNFSLKPEGGGCCPDNSIGSDYDVNGAAVCILPGGQRPHPALSSPLVPEPVTDDIQVFTVGEERWQCPAEDCLMDVAPGNAAQQLLSSNSTIATPLTMGQRAAYNCMAQGTSLSGHIDSAGATIPADMFCAFQAAVPAPIATLLSSNSDISSCLEIEGSEQERCLECLGKNVDARQNGEPESFVYSSIGCVDTRQDQFITRLFQIGLGTMSGIAVIQVMWGSVEMQSTDPAKIQQGRERAVAALVACLTIAAAIPILQYIGISVTQLLPSSFLN